MRAHNVNRGSVAAIIINYNGGGELLKCIDSLSKQTYKLAEIIVVDNKSTDGSIAAAKQLFGQVRYIENGGNLGWGVGCNIGIAASTSEYILLVNNDAYLYEDCALRMVETLDSDASIGSCASKILLQGDMSLIEAAGVVIYPDGSSVGRGRLRPVAEYSEKTEVFCANDCCCLYRRQMLEEIGTYDPDFFIYCDETDVGWRQQLAGWKCIYNPEAIACHAHSLSAGHYSDFKAFHVERNRLFLCFKYFPVTDMAAAIVYSLQRFVMQVWCSRKGVGALTEYRKSNSLFHGFVILLKAHLAAFRTMPVMLRRRKEFMVRRKLSDSEFRGLFRKYGLSVRQMAEYV